MPYYLKLTINIAIAIILLSLWGFYTAIRPFRFMSDVTPANYGVKYELITLETKDHIKITGWFINSSQPTKKSIILLHGYPADKGNILPATLFLHQKYNLLYIDFRYHGESGGSHTTLGKEEVQDLQAAVNFLKARHLNQIGIYGFSLGGAVGLMGVATMPDIKAIVAISSYARLDWLANNYYRIPILKYPLAALTRLWAVLFLGYDINEVTPYLSTKNIHIPVLIIHSKQDDVVPFEHALLLQESLKQNSKAVFIFTDHDLHGEMIQSHDKTIQQFFDANLK